MNTRRNEQAAARAGGYAPAGPLALADLLAARPGERTEAERGPQALADALGNLLAHRHREGGGAAEDAERVRLAAHALCMADAAGHACLPLATLAHAPEEIEAWRAALAASPVVSVAGNHSAAHPAIGPAPGRSGAAARALVLDPQDRLYTLRYWQAECALARRWRDWQHDAPLAEPAAARAVLDALFGAPGADTDWQRCAVALALLRPALVLSGGPGTGKTTTVVRLIAALLALQADLDIALVAPTGKAAARMQEALRAQRAGLPVGEAVRDRLPDTARTVHALLGIGADGTRARHRRGNPLGADVVIVDEASMLGLMLAARLFDALKPGARIVLVGDRDQLASVESGIVLATLSRVRGYTARQAAALAALGAPVPAALVAPDGAAAADVPAEFAAGLGRAAHAAAAADAPGGPAAWAAPTRDAVVWLERSHRFDSGGGIGRAARAIQAGDARALFAVLADSAEARWPGTGTPDQIADAALAGYAAYLASVRAHAAPAEALAAFERYRVLAALRLGPRGAAGLNAAIERRARRALEAGATAAWYHGRPVIATRNDALLQVFNGDIGLCLAGADGRLAVHFRRADGSVRAFAPGRLDACEDAWALTVHKSQGSEFEAVDIVLPQQPARVVVRELVYTALTRARSQVRIWSPEDVLAAGVQARTERHSGLAERLAEALVQDRRNESP